MMVNVTEDYLLEHKATKYNSAGVKENAEGRRM